MTASPIDAAKAWLAEDPDPDTRAELAALLDAGDDAELADRFGARLEFGTAGLRGALGAGPNRMNRAVVMRAAAGLSSYVKANGGTSVVIGYDARHKSDVFAHDTAAVVAGYGLVPLVLPKPLPTPVLAFAIRHLGASAGVMVTASHNPPQDNGYKVYLGDGAQIVPPADAEISAAIEAVADLASIPTSDDWTVLDETVLDAYLAAVSSMPLLQDLPQRDVSIVYTPLHGVGRDVVVAAFERAGFPLLQVVSAQGDPDPEFPTVAFPNPEEPGAIDLAVAAAQAASAEIVIANDPDADRCAIALPVTPGQWRMLRGDEVGALLADFLLRNGIRGRYATTIVSSSLLSAMAARHSMPYSETLTGFKWIVKAGDDLVFGYEEALGYCVAPNLTRDKDGISAALLLALLAASLKSAGSSLPQRLDEIAREYGLFATDQLSIRVADITQISAAVARLRAAPPTSLGGLPVVSVEDLAEGVGGLPPTDGLRYRLDGSARGTGVARVVVRPSGTEPKLKSYLEVVVPVRTSVDDARAVAREQLDAVRDDLAKALALS
ncbi:MAG TPA: phospho-sugar mutase [Acidothermaceae bacterium]|nr:phospho-sugar mutase [Acidothermaceae bacterium]